MRMTHKNSGRKFVPMLMGFMALIIYGVGLISPLTPSEGGPSLAMLLIFVGIPLVLTVGGAMATRSKIIKGILIIAASIIIVFTIYLLRIQRVI